MAQVIASIKQDKDQQTFDNPITGKSTAVKYPGGAPSPKSPLAIASTFTGKGPAMTGMGAISGINGNAPKVAQQQPLAYRAGEATRNAVNTISDIASAPSKKIGDITADVIANTGKAASEFYRGVTGDQVKGPISDANAAEKAPASTGKPGVPPAATATGAVSEIANTGSKEGKKKSKASEEPTRWEPGAQVSDVGQGFFATGQGNPTHQRWAVRVGDTIKSVVLPIGQDPNAMSQDQLKGLVQNETLADLDTSKTKVTHGMRTEGENRTADQVAALIEEYRKGVSGVSDEATPQDRAAISGIAQQASQSSAAENVAGLNYRAALAAAAAKAAKDSTKVENITINWANPNNPLDKRTVKLPVVFNADGTKEIFNGNYSFRIGKDGVWIPPSGVSEPILKNMAYQFQMIQPGLANINVGEE